MRWRVVWGWLGWSLVVGCGGGGSDGGPLSFVAVTFNTGTSEGMGSDDPDHGGYTTALAAISDQYYGDGLAWQPAVEATREFLARVQPDVVGFQEIFYPAECAAIPAEARAGFICQDWSEGDPTVAQLVLGQGYQVMCHPGKPDKCAAVRRGFGRFEGCQADFCLEGLAGFRVEGCGQGSRVGRGVIELAAGGRLTLVNFHGSSGLAPEDQACRVKQVEQVFVDLGDGRPGADGERNLILGDFNTDPGRWASFDPSAARLDDFVGPAEPFWFITRVGQDAPGSYMDLVDIDHMISDSIHGSCWHAGLGDQPPVIAARYFDHRPVVCALELEER